MDTRLTELLVCPICKGPLEHHRHQERFYCAHDKLSFPVRDGIPIMLESEAIPDSAASTHTDVHSTGAGT